VNHEYTNEELMFPGVGVQDGKAAFAKMTKDLVDIEIAAHGGAVVEIRREANGPWQVVRTSSRNRRITADTPDGDHRTGRGPRAHAHEPGPHRPGACSACSTTARAA
jgi:secreted PhoX family phosphatase